MEKKAHTCCELRIQWRRRLGNVGDGMTQGEGILGDGSHPVGHRGEDPIGDLVDEPPSRYLFWKWM